MPTLRQPWLHDLVTALQAPTVALSSADGQIREGGAQGVLHADVRVLSRAELTVDGAAPELVSSMSDGASRVRFTGLVRSLGDDGPDPTVRIGRDRRVTSGEVVEEISVISYARGPVVTVAELHLAGDLAAIEAVKSGRAASRTAPRAAITVVDPTADSVTLSWGADGVTAELRAVGPGVTAVSSDGHAILRWPVDLPAAGSRTLRWTLRAEVADAPVTGASTAGSAWHDVRVSCGDHRLTALAEQSLADLRALLMAPIDRPHDVFAAAGAPWFFTLFGRDSIWAARLMLPFGWELAAGTLRALAARQGERVDPATGEAPGKIPHELRRAATVHDGVNRQRQEMRLPPLYYGTVDATPLWVCLLHDGWRAGMPQDQVRALLPNLRAALDWITDLGDADSDGFLEYLDTSGHGLANQGWKDSGDSIRFADGRQADGPVALCEVQGYAHEAATHGADLLDAFGEPGAAARLRGWAGELNARFREHFWVSDAQGPYPALALDGAKRPVDSLTSNIGHLLGTGLLDESETATVLDRLTGPTLDSGFGLRTMSCANGGYSPFSYHCGSVWPHDTAIVIRAMAAAGHSERALGLIEGLLAAGARFSWRLPELYSGDARTETPWPAPYPAACRPQAWAAAAIGAIIQALLVLDLDVPGGGVGTHPVEHSPFGTLQVSGLAGGRIRPA